VRERVLLALAPNLGTPPAGGTAFISPDLSTGSTVFKSGYQVTMSSSIGVAPDAPPTCNGLAAGAAMQGYFATATPSQGGGTKAFGTNANHTIYFATPDGAACHDRLDGPGRRLLDPVATGAPRAAEDR